MSIVDGTTGAHHRKGPRLTMRPIGDCPNLRIPPAIVKEKSVVETFLSRHGWLSFTSPDFRAAVPARTELHDFAKGEPVYLAVDPPGGLWALIDGAVELESGPLGAAPHLMHFESPGFWFGKPRPFSVCTDW